jgi:hypothetical protein
VAHPITVRNLFDALTNSTGGRLHFLIYHKYLNSLDKYAIMLSEQHSVSFLNKILSLPPRTTFLCVITSV